MRREYHFARNGGHGPQGAILARLRVRLASMYAVSSVLFFAALIPLAYAQERSLEAYTASRRGPVLIASIEGAITPAKDDYLREALEAAKEQDARLLVVRLNTPGGLITSMFLPQSTLLLEVREQSQPARSSRLQATLPTWLPERILEQHIR